MNEHDSSVILKLLSDRGFQPTANPKDADIILINTCSVRAKAEHKAMSELGRFSLLKKRKRELLLGIGGCLAQQGGSALFKQVPALDLVFGPDRIGELPEMIEEVRQKGRPVVRIGFDDGEKGATWLCTLPDGGDKLTAFVTISKGCDNYCTFCVVPYVRGPERSRPWQDIVREVKDLAGVGVVELTLLGQNVNSYGKQDGQDVDFPELLKRVAEVAGIQRVRFTTSHPKDLSRRLARAFADIPELCEHIHLPFQSGSDRILKLMGRRYTRAGYLEKVRWLRAARPDIALSSDVIVGFPGESESDFQETLSLMREIEFDSLFSFRYSPRPLTAARRLPDHIPDHISMDRFQRLLEVHREIFEKHNREQVGRSVEVLVEGRSRRGMSGETRGQLTGRSRQNRIVNFQGSDELIGKLVEVVITESLANSLRGRPKGI